MSPPPSLHFFMIFFKTKFIQKLLSCKDVSCQKDAFCKFMELGLGTNGATPPFCREDLVYGPGKLLREKYGVVWKWPPGILLLDKHCLYQENNCV